jgi:malonyl-CoA decarboxylase
MPQLLTNLLQMLRDRRGTDMGFLCRRLMSERGEASQTALAQEIITSYKGMPAERRREFFEMLCHDFAPDQNAIFHAAANFKRAPGTETLAELSSAVEAPRQELIRRINTAPGGTHALVTLREHLLQTSPNGSSFEALDADLKHLFRSWFNRGFLRLERISWQTSALILEKLIRYESVHEINGWPDLHRRLEADRRCFAFFHPALAEEPIIFVEVALSNGLTGDLEPLLDVGAPVLTPENANTAIFYSINNCLPGLRNIPFGNFLIKQVVAELAAELPNIKTYSTLSPLPRFSKTLMDRENQDGFTRERLSLLLAEHAKDLIRVAGIRDPVAALFELLQTPYAHRDVLAAPLRHLALAYLTKARHAGKLCDQVATFHLSNGARLERINAFGNLRPYGLEASFGVTANYRYLPDELEENHERFVRGGQIRVSAGLFREHKQVDSAWDPTRKTQHQDSDNKAKH